MQYPVGAELLLTDGREVTVTDVPEYDRDLLVVQDGGKVAVINTFQVEYALGEVVQQHCTSSPSYGRVDLPATEAESRRHHE